MSRALTIAADFRLQLLVEHRLVKNTVLFIASSPVPKHRPFENVNTDVVQFQGQILTRCVALNPRTRRPYTLQVQHKQYIFIH